MSTRYGRRIALVCFLLSFALRLGILFGTGLNQKQERTEMISVATTFARTGTLANAYMSMPTGPTAHVAPLYPMLVGGFYRMFGEGRAAEDVRQALACGVSALRAALVVLFALEFGLDEGASLASGLIAIFYIGAFDTELKGDWEGPFAGDLLLLLVLWGWRMIARGIPALRESLVYGMAWGAALLTAPSLLPVGAGFVLLAFAVRYRQGARSMGAILLAWAAGVLLVLSPWIVRNYEVLGGFVWGRDNFGLELSVSNGPGAHWSNPQNQRRIFSMHPSRYRPAAERLAAMGEIAFNRERQRDAAEWIRNNPAQFLALTAQRALHFWFPPGRNTAHHLILTLFTLAALAGCFLLWRRGSPAFLVVAVLWVAYPLMYYLIQWSSRYRLPVDWSLILCAAVALSAAWRGLHRRAVA